MLLTMIGEIKVSCDQFRCVFSCFSTSRRCSGNRSPGRHPVSPMSKQRVILMGRLAGPEIFSMLQMIGHVLHRARAHLKVSG